MNEKKRLAAGILAHVDAGKTTLSESILYLSGSIRQIGRVDHQSAFLDTHELERARGITIFSKQAVFSWKDMDVTLLDTPGHVDFSAEMERTLQVLDYAILVISGADGVQGHTETLWRLLSKYQIPVFLFINKMDQEGTSRETILNDLKKRLDDNCLDFSDYDASDRIDDNRLEQLAMCDDELMEEYLTAGTCKQNSITDAIYKRKIFPCYFGSALRVEGVKEFLDGFEKYTKAPKYHPEFGAKVYKITRDEQGGRLTCLKVTGGSLKVKDVLVDDEKVNQIRIYSGSKYETVPVAPAGVVCAVTGLNTTYPGQGIGAEAASGMPLLEPVLAYRVHLPKDCDVHKMLLDLRQLEEEEPQLHVRWEAQLSEIHVLLMGEVQIEVLKTLIKQRFGVDVEFDSGSIMYRETITASVEGVGHFEPLRHYAEVHLLLEPAEQGTGMHFAADCSEDILDRNWQRLILTHLEEKEHKGILTGSPITDIKITLITGKAHVKHTEGGDFRQATYRAVRQGLKKAHSILLEPYYQYRLEVPSENIGRAMADIQRMHGDFEPPLSEGEFCILSGSAPVATMGDYQTELLAYTGGRGRLFCSLKGYEPCHNAEAVIAEKGYDSEADTENPTGSVFCSHGAGFVVKWDQVEEYMHIESGLHLEKDEFAEAPDQPQSWSGSRIDSRLGSQSSGSSVELTSKELAAIYVRTPDPVRSSNGPVKVSAPGQTNMDSRGKTGEKDPQQENYLLVDGYNIVFAWEDLRELAELNIESARHKLMDILCNYQGYKGCTLILVFDAYKVEGNPGEISKYHNIHVVYTKEAETADQYIEKTVVRIGKKYQVTVATSDALEQMIIMGHGAVRLSANGLREEIKAAVKEMHKEHLAKASGDRNYLFDYLSEDIAREMEKVRLGKKDLN